MNTFRSEIMHQYLVYSKYKYMIFGTVGLCLCQLYFPSKLAWDQTINTNEFLFLGIINTNYSVFTTRNHQLMGGYLHPAHKQCSKSHSLHFDHTTLQGDPPAGLDQLQAATTITQQPSSPSSFLYLAGNVASS